MTEYAANSMKWTSALSTRPSLEAAIDEVVAQAQRSLQVSADLGIVFISAAFASEYPRLMPLLQERLPNLTIVGCGGSGVLGVDLQQQEVREIEDGSALVLTLAHLPGVKLHAFHLSAEALPDLDSAPGTWIDLVGVPASERPNFILLADPFSSKINDLLQGLDYAYPDAVKVGGLASGGVMGSPTGLFCNYQLYREGAVGLAMSGSILMETIVAQGCRPIGQPYRVIEAERNIILGVEEQPKDAFASRVACPQQTPLEVLQNIIQDLSDDDRALAQDSLFIGVAQSEFKQSLDQGDFLIRRLLGVDPRLGAIAIGDRIRPGQRIQFHLRDDKTSAEDLEMLLLRYQDETDPNTSAIGALMFACMGRGEGLYGEPDFDSHLFNRYLHQVPLSGFFCNGEIGPVGSSTFLHGYTSVFGICRQP